MTNLTITREQVAKKANCSIRTVWRWEEQGYMPEAQEAAYTLPLPYRVEDIKEIMYYKGSVYVWMKDDMCIKFAARMPEKRPQPRGPVSDTTHGD